jgi:hypothetical protein
MPSSPPNGIRPGRLPRSRRVLLLIHFINPFGFPGADKLAAPALEAAEMQARELVICGLATDMCVQLTAMDAFLREFRAWVPADCTAAESPAARKASLEYMAAVLKCDTNPTTRPPKSKGGSRRAAHA